MRLVATWRRWAVGSGALAAGFVVALQAYLSLTRSQATISSFGVIIALFAAVTSLLVLAALRSEEARLALELRIARSGTSVRRSVLLGRPQPTPLVARLFSTRLGRAANLLAEDDRPAAMDALAGGSPFMQGGRLERLREVLGADAERATGTPAGLDTCIERLRAMAPIGHRESDLYRVHVHAKALLQRGDREGALELTRKLVTSSDGEESIYAIWLRVWFDLDAEAGDAVGWPPLTDVDLRIARLLARGHGARDLVAELEERMASVAPTDGQ